MTMKTSLLTFSTFLLLHAAHAQFYNDGALTNDGGLISDWQTQWFNTANGVFTGTNNGVFEHHGPSSQTFVNNGTFSALTGHTNRFSGPLGAAGTQEIGGTARPFFYHLELNNGATETIQITNSDGANVRASVIFNNGITTTVRNVHQAGALRFESGASYTGGNTDAQHVDGYVSKSGTDAFTFPIGNGTDLRTLSIGAPAVPSEISVAWVAGSPGSTTDPSDGSTHSTTAFAAPIVSVIPSGFWDYVLVSGNDDGLPVSVSVPELSGFSLAPDLRLIGWNGTQWIDLSGGATATGNTENSTLSGTIPAGTAITALGIGSISALLPVHFASFTVTSTLCEVDVKWSTATEDNNAFFVVERSTDGVAFGALAQIPGAGNSTLLRTYAYKDRSPAPGNSYYRIRQVDLDGRHTTTGIQAARLQCGNEAAIKVYPTITRSQVNVFLTEGFKGAQVSLFDLSGRRMPVMIQRSSLKCTISMSGIPSGQYMVQVVKDHNAQTFKIVKP